LDCFRYGIGTFAKRWIETHRKLNVLSKHPTGQRPDTLRGRGREALDRYIGS
jgi:hypothetical protein